MDAQTTEYDPRTFKGLTFHDARSAFADGSDTPSAYLERCLETVAAREPVVQAFASLNEEAARAAAAASSKRWKDGNPLSAIDGMPVGIKDLLETRDMPTQLGCAAFDGNFPKNDNAAVWALRQAGAVAMRANAGPRERRDGRLLRGPDRKLTGARRVRTPVTGG